MGQCPSKPWSLEVGFLKILWLSCRVVVGRSVSVGKQILLLPIFTKYLFSCSAIDSGEKNFFSFTARNGIDKSFRFFLLKASFIITLHVLVMLPFSSSSLC